MWKPIVSLLLLGCTLSSGFLIQDEGLLVFFEGLNVTLKAQDANKEPTSVQFTKGNTVVSYEVLVVPPKTPEDVRKHRQIQMQFTRTPVDPNVKNLAITLTLSTGISYWGMTNITVSVEGPLGNDKLTDTRFISNNVLEAPEGKSFHCSTFGKIYPAWSATASGNFTPVIEFYGLQAQVNNGTAQIDAFAEPWECVGFFTAGIWAGIFVVAFLIGILTWGMAMIMDVKTMDRFDDPKGKPISFGGAE